MSEEIDVMGVLETGIKAAEKMPYNAEEEVTKIKEEYKLRIDKNGLENVKKIDGFNLLLAKIQDFIKTNKSTDLLEVAGYAIYIRRDIEDILARQPREEPILEIINEDDIRNEVITLIKDRDTTRACHTLASYYLKRYNLFTLSDTGEILVYQKGAYVPRGEEIISKSIQEILQDFCKIHLVGEIMGHIKRSTLVPRELLKEPLDKLCLQNGILDVKTLKITDHTPDIFFFNKIPVPYVSTADCPLIKKFLNEIVGTEGVSLLQEFTGYCLYKEHFIHKAFMLVGGGANGKSTFLRLLKAFLGHENVTSVPLQNLENNRFSLSSLFGKLANIFADLSSKGLSGTSIFKMLVGQDLIPAEKKFRDQFFFENYAKMIFSANQIPKSPEDTDAFFRRWIIILFPNQFLKNADKNLFKKISTPEELSGFLNFAIEGLKRLLEKGDFTVNKSIETTREQYIRMSDSVGAFIMDLVQISPDSYIPKKELYTSYCDYCRSMSYPIVSDNLFYKDLQKAIRVEDYRPLMEINGTRERVQCWKGIKIILKRENCPDMIDIPDTTGKQEPNNVNLVRDVNPFLPIKDNQLDDYVNHVNDVNLSGIPEFVSEDKLKIETIKVP